MGKPNMIITFNFVSPYDPKRKFTRVFYAKDKPKLTDSIERINALDQDKTCIHVDKKVFRDYNKVERPLSKKEEEKKKKEKTKTTKKPCRDASLRLVNCIYDRFDITEDNKIQLEPDELVHFDGEEYYSVISRVQDDLLFNGALF